MPYVDEFSREARFWLNIEHDDSLDCWVWAGVRDSGGYGHTRINGRQYRAHRVAYELFVGVIPEGMHVDHLCRNRACINPDHMELVTPRENVLRGVGISAENARKTACIHGHLFDAANTYVSKTGRRQCRECHRIRQSKINKRRYAA